MSRRRPHVEEYEACGSRRLSLAMVVRICEKLLSHRGIDMALQEYHPQLYRLAFSYTYRQAAPSLVDSTTRYHIRARIHFVRLLLRHYENLCASDPARG